MFRYTLPFLYTFIYNRKGIEALAYFLEYIVLLFLFLFVLLVDADVLLLGLSLTAFMSIYEIGYIENNVIAIKKDTKPTIRHSQDGLLYLEKNLQKIFLFRYLIAFVLVFLLSFWVDVVWFVLLLILTRVVFYLYNIKYRTGLVHRMLFGGLRFLRYFSPIFFLGWISLLLAVPVTVVNMFNNYAWYDRSSIHLPRFFGTKLFDALMYFGFFMLFLKVFDYSEISKIFLYLVGIKMFLFMMVLLKKRL